MTNKQKKDKKMINLPVAKMEKCNFTGCKTKKKITINLEKSVISHQGAMERAAARGAGGVAPGMELGVEDNNLYCCVQLLLLSIMGGCVGCNFRF